MVNMRSRLHHVQTHIMADELSILSCSFQHFEIPHAAVMQMVVDLILHSSPAGRSRWLWFCLWWPIGSRGNIPWNGLFQRRGCLPWVYCDLHPSFRVRRCFTLTCIGSWSGSSLSLSEVRSLWGRRSILPKGNPIHLQPELVEGKICRTESGPDFL
jgi:hypothetical protein